MRSDIIPATYNELYGQPCWGLHYSRLLGLSMSFGKPSLRVREPLASESKSKRVRKMLARRNVVVKGEWWLWITLCHWRISMQDKTLATGAASVSRIEEAMLELGGQKLTSVQFNPANGATCFAFDLGGMLECRRRSKDRSDNLWLLYKPDGYVLSIHGHGQFAHQPGSATIRRLRPLPLRDSRIEAKRHE